MLVRSRLPMSAIWRRTFATGRAGSGRGWMRCPFALDPGGRTSTRCSFLGLSALPKSGPDLLGCDWGKLANGVRRQAIALIDVLAVPSAGEGFDNSRCFPAMPIQGPSNWERQVVPEPFARTNMC
jgi:hypothetical protein